MVERYGRDVMRNVWTEENKFRAYLKVELLAAEAWSELGVVPREDKALQGWDFSQYHISKYKPDKTFVRIDRP